MRTFFLTSLMLTALCTGLAGCFPVVVGTRARVSVGGELALVEPGVWVVADYPHAVYFVDDAYWWWSDGVWYRSRRYDGGWVRVGLDVVPVRVRGLDHKKYRYYVDRGHHGPPAGPPGHRDGDDDGP